MIKGSKHLKETIEKLREASTGRKHTEETKQKNRLSHLGKEYKPMSDEGRENIRKAHLGCTIPKEQRLKISATLKAKGIKRTEEERRFLSEIHKGEKNYQWKGGTEGEYKRIRKSVDFKLWREAVFKRDNYICQKKHKRIRKLHPHHILNFAQYPELRFDINNGITLSEEAHMEFHKTYGQENNTKQQLQEFLEGMAA